MTLMISSLAAEVEGKDQVTLITAKSGMMVNVQDHEWHILPNKGKGHKIRVEWIYNSLMDAEDRKLIIDVLIHYVRTKSASTAAGIVYNTKPTLLNGIPTLTSLRTAWSGLFTSNKKGLNQFFGTLSKQGYKRFDAYHQFTTSHLDKEERNALDPSKGALSEIEFDSLAKQINNRLRGFEWTLPRELSYYLQSTSGFGELRNSVTNKLMLSTVRRPIQLSILKWGDLIPTGESFNDSNIKPSDELGSIGAQTLQLRVFYAKESSEQASRSSPERYPIYLSEDLSSILVNYKKLYLTGLLLYLKSLDVNFETTELLHVMNDMPMFPESILFSAKFDSIGAFRSMFTPVSTAFHIGEGAITSSIRRVEIISDRLSDCLATNNRIRHTVLTRGAQAGLSATQLARITGVTVPAARHYVDMDYQSRRMIDTNYVGNEFLKQAFTSTITLVPEGDEIIFDQHFNEVGGAQCKTSCMNCSAVLGRPLSCYGCPNFRPILEADHRAILKLADEKLRLNKISILSPLHIRSIEKLQRQIEWVKLTISICDEIIMKKKAIDAK
ncbi:hypothetical protein [Cellvibrio sp. KY-YJ-3]|uniref:hypothetical protein n=1 Tax=Cellvibrio sp. KY-YJ-3 TaxID=454662 RepID=UPI001CDA002B|nr:hypothetical protein [Cellvibrio sp. KY-YJ-3]